MAKKSEVSMSYSKFKHSLANLLLAEGFVASVDEKEEWGFKQLLIGLKYEQGSPRIAGIKRISKPGQRIYMNHKDLPQTFSGFGVTVISTSKGLMTDKNAKKQKVGGEIICQIW